MEQTEDEKFSKNTKRENAPSVPARVAACLDKEDRGKL